MPHLKYLNTYWKVASDEVWITGSCALCCRIIWLAFLSAILIFSSLALSLCTDGGILIAYLAFSLFIFLCSLICEILIIRTSITGSISEHDERDKKLVFYLRFRYGIAFIEILLSIFGCFIIAYRPQSRADLPCSPSLDYASFAPIGQILLGIVIASQFIESLVMIFVTLFQYNQPLDIQPDEIIKQFKSRRRGQVSANDMSAVADAQQAYEAFAFRARKHLRKGLRMLQVVTCNLFGGNQVIDEEYVMLGKLLSSLFHHGGFLDLVATDLVAGMILVASEQKEQRRMKYSARNNIKNMEDATRLYRAPDDLSDSSNDQSGSYVMHLENSSFVVEPPPHLADLPPAPRIMDLANEADRKLLEDASRYSVMALGCYTHLFALLLQPVTGLCDMTCTNLQHTDGVAGCNRVLCCANTVDATANLGVISSNAAAKTSNKLKSPTSSSLTEPLNIHEQQRHNAVQDAIERGVDIDTIDEDGIQGNKYLSAAHSHVHHRNNGCCCCWTPNTFLLQSREKLHNIYYNKSRDRYTKSDNCWKANETGMVHLTKLRTKAKIKYASFQDNVGMKPYIIYHGKFFIL